MIEFAPLPEELKRQSGVYQWLLAAAQDIVNQGAVATPTEIGLVFQGLAVSNALASGVSVDAPDAPTQTGSYVQADVQDIADLANELKADVNQLVTDVNALKDVLNELLQSQRDAEQIVS